MKRSGNYLRVLLTLINHLALFQTRGDGDFIRQFMQQQNLNIVEFTVASDNIFALWQLGKLFSSDYQATILRSDNFMGVMSGQMSPVLHVVQDINNASLLNEKISSNHDDVWLIDIHGGGEIIDFCSKFTFATIDSNVFLFDGINIYECWHIRVSTYIQTGFRPRSLRFFDKIRCNDIFMYPFSVQSHRF